MLLLLLEDEESAAKGDWLPKISCSALLSHCGPVGCIFFLSISDITWCVV